MKQVVLVLLTTISVVSGRDVWAQARWYVAPRAGYGGYGNGGYSASTPASAAGHAMADMTRSQGMYNQMTSAAMINTEKARGEYIANQKEWTDLYLMRQRVVDAEHAKQKEDARTRNAKMQEFQASHPSDLPQRLTSSELDPSTGKITWPAALMRDSLAVQRQELEALFTSRAHTGTTSEMSDTIYKKVRAMQDELRKYIREIVTQEYMEARKFLDRLSLEGRFPIG